MVARTSRRRVLALGAGALLAAPAILRPARAQGKAVVSGDKDRDRHLIGANFAEYLESVHLRHLNVEKHQVRFAVLNCLHSGFSVTAFAHDLHAGVFANEAPYGAASQRLVVDDQRPDAHRDCSWRKTGAERNGIESSAQTPVGSRFCRRNSCCFP